MTLKNELKALMVERDLTTKQVAEVLGITAEALRRRMNLEKFNAQEMQTLTDLLEIENPSKFFFGR